MGLTYTHPDDCECYECVGQRLEWHNGRRVVVNNMKHHTFGEECSECGHEKSEYRDLGWKGYYGCWWCRERTADPGELRE